MVKQKQEQVSLLLVFPDEARSAKISALIVEAFGDSMSLVHADSFWAGLDEAVRRRHDLVIVDQTVDAHEGQQLADLMRKRHVAPPPVLLIGSDDSSGLVRLSAFSGAVAYLDIETLSVELLKENVEYALRTGEEAKKIAEQTRDLEQFAHLAAHDLRSPLRSTIALLDMIYSDIGHDLSRDDLGLFRLMEENLERMSQLVEDLLNYARLGVDRADQQVDLGECLDYARQALAADIKETDAKVTAEELPTITGDRGSLTRLLQNLIGNALKYHGEAAPKITVSALKRENGWDLRVSDNGIGIDEKHHKMIFKPLKRVHGKDEYDGSGLGLAACRRIMQQHDGKIRVESTPGEGSTFICHFPVIESGEPETP